MGQPLVKPVIVLVATLDRITCVLRVKVNCGKQNINNNKNIEYCTQAHMNMNS